jgi:twitching motility protein PilT
MAVFEDDLSLLVHELNSGTAAAKVVDKRGALDSLLQQAARQNASDVILAAGAAATFRVNGALASGTGRVLTAEDLRGLLLPLLSKDQIKELETNRALDILGLTQGLF